MMTVKRSLARSHSTSTSPHQHHARSETPAVCSKTTAAGHTPCVALTAAVSMRTGTAAVDMRGSAACQAAAPRCHFAGSAERVSTLACVHGHDTDGALSDCCLCYPLPSPPLVLQKAG
jgi:hypothetical protein